MSGCSKIENETTLAATLSKMVKLYAKRFTATTWDMLISMDSDFLISEIRQSTKLPEPIRRRDWYQMLTTDPTLLSYLKETSTWLKRTRINLRKTNDMIEN